MFLIYLASRDFLMYFSRFSHFFSHTICCIICCSHNLILGFSSCLIHLSYHVFHVGFSLLLIILLHGLLILLPSHTAFLHTHSLGLQSFLVVLSVPSQGFTQSGAHTLMYKIPSLDWSCGRDFQPVHKAEVYTMCLGHTAQ